MRNIGIPDHRSRHATRPWRCRLSELPDTACPWSLTTGRILYHWHGGEMTRRTGGLLAVHPRTLIEISPEDAAKLGLNGTEMVRVISRRGEVVAHTIITERVAPGVIFGNFHFPRDLYWKMTTCQNSSPDIIDVIPCSA